MFLETNATFISKMYRIMCCKMVPAKEFFDTWKLNFLITSISTISSPYVLQCIEVMCFLS